MALSKLLLIREADLVILGVSWSGYTVAVGTPPKLVPDVNDARIALTFPPQAVGEEKLAVGELEVMTLGSTLRQLGARLAGPSRVEFQPMAGREVPLTAAGLLEALADPDSIIVPGTSDPSTGTTIELPWRLVSTVTADRSMLAENASTLVQSPTGVTGLFRTRLHSSAGTPADAGLSLVPLQALVPGHEIPNFSPLGAAHRDDIVAISLTTGRLAKVTQLELSALGGTLSVGPSWPEMDWRHKTVLGRDMDVRVVTRGILYPFGHRAQVEESASRGFGQLPAFPVLPDDSPFGREDVSIITLGVDAEPPGPPGNAVAALQGRTTLSITEPVVMAASNPRLARKLPFGAVEITTTWLDLATPVWMQHSQPALSSTVDELVAERDDLVRQLNDYIDTFPRTIADYIAGGWGSSSLLPDIEYRLSVAQQVLDDLRAAIPPTEPPVDPPVDPPPWIDDPPIGSSPPVTIEPLPPSGDSRWIPALLYEQIQQAEAEVAALRREYWTVQQEVQQGFATLARDIPTLAAQGDTSAQRVLAINERLTAIAATDPKHRTFFTPQGLGGQLLKLPVRGIGRHGDVLFSMPVVFVADIDIPASDGFEGFSSLTDDSVMGEVQAEWGNGGKVPMPGTRIDLVQAAEPREADVQEVHEMVLSATRHEGGFRAVLDQVLVELPTLRALLPESIEKVAIHYTEEFLSDGVEALIALRPKLPIKIDFGDVADRSGGLVVPNFLADVISPHLGPVALDALSDVGDSLQSILADTKLLGMSLGQLVAGVLPDLPGTPKIVPIMKNNLPSGVEMTWKLKLQSHDLFIVGPNGLLDLKVRRSADKSTTSCSVSDFSLSIPSGKPLVKLNFGALRFVQEQGKAPDVDIVDLKLDFGGALQLIRTLLNEVQKLIGSGGPSVTPGSSGVMAEYTINVPNISSGVFVMRNITVHLGVDIPFTRKPVTVSLGFARRDNPFNLSVLMFGGGGYIDFTVGPKGLIGLEASMEFGARIEMNLVVAQGEVHALGGVRFELADGAVSLAAFIRIGGSVEVLGLVSISVELVVTLEYVNDANHNRLVGRATLVIEVDVTLFAESVELDSGEWVLAGDERPQRAVTQGVTHAAPPPDAPPPNRQQQDAMRQYWQNYRKAFA